MTRFSYQGACDLVFVRNKLVEIQIRTAFGRNEYFSFVSNVAISIGGDVLEVFSNRTYIVNGIQPLNQPPATFGGFYPVSVGSDNNFIQIALSGGQKIKVSFYFGTITLEIAAHISDFGDSVGLMGSYSDFEFPYRDGSVRFPADSISQNASDYANEWSVSVSKGDKSLIAMPSQREGCKEASPFPSNPSLLQRAIAACANLTDNDTNQNCIFDIMATGDTIWAANPGYTDPLQPPMEQCVDAKSNECALAGGECRWRCNDSQFVCLPGICTEIDELSVFETQSAGRERAEIDGCSCALPIPTSSPTVSRSRLNEIITCIAVIDESYGSNVAAFPSLWTEFRRRYPERPFCLLQPGPNPIIELFVPKAFLNDTNTIYSQVARDFGNNKTISDWFEICNLSASRLQGITDVAIFIDNSGSLTTDQIQASFDYLRNRMAAEKMNLVAGIYNNAENWISPFLTDFN